MRQLPYPAQLAWLDERLAAHGDPGDLLRECAALPDHGPLVHLLRRLSERDLLGAPAVAQAFSALLDGGAETAAQQALAALPRLSPPALVDTIAQACRRLPLARLQVTGLALRWLGREAPERREQLRQEALARCMEALDTGRDPDDPWLVLAPGAALRAAPGGEAALERFAGRLLAALAGGPRSLSQANAEELLARRVYEGRGHFLFELLQNADDARATRVGFTLAGGELRVLHDGAPFDARDVLGVLSVGQSTKEAGDIGLFGVGFRSVYAVTERPRVYSGPFCFEISGMSRPRPVDPADRPLPGETLLALPLDRPGVEASALLAEARRIPAEVLLTLRHVRRLDVSGPDGASRTRLLTAGHEARLLDEVTGAERRYLVAYGSSGDSLVAVALDERGAPRALRAGEPSVYCFLPTREEAGLPCLIHARFEVPLDRERLRREAPSNRRRLGEAGEALASVVGALAEQGRYEPLEALLGLLAEARPQAYFAVVLDTARALVAAMPLLRAMDGRRLPAGSVRRVAPSLAGALAGVALDEQGRVALAPPDAGLEKALPWLQVAPFAPVDLLALLERTMRGCREGDPCPAPFVRSAGALAAELARLPASEARRRDALPWVAVPGADGEERCHRASAVRLATGEQAALYGPLRPLRVEDRAGSEAWAGVGVRWLEDREIIADLRDEAMRSALVQRAGVEALLTYLEKVAPGLLTGLGGLPLFAREDGRVGPLRGEGAARLWPAGPLGDWLAVRPALSAELVQREVQRAHGPLLRALGGRELEPAELFEDLAHRTAPLDSGEAAGLLALAAQSWRSWAPQALDALRRAPLFLSTEGRLQALDELSRPAESEALERFFQKLGLRPRITPEGLRLAAGMGLESHLAPGDFEGLLRELVAGQLDPSEHRAELIALLSEGAGRLPARLLRQLAGVPMFLASDGRLRPLAPWGESSTTGPCHRAAAPWRATLELGSAPLLDAREEQAWGPLLDALGCPPAGASDWVNALESDPALSGASGRHAARATALERPARRALEPHRVRLAALPLWRSQGGAWHPAAALVEPRELDALLGEPWSSLLPGVEAQVLHDDDEPEALALRDLFTFRPAISLLDEQLRGSARVGRPLSEQPPALASLERLLRLGEVARARGLTGWPLGLDVSGALASGRLLRASAEEVTLLQGTALCERLAHPGWSARQAAVVLEPLTAARALEAFLPWLRDRGVTNNPQMPPERRAQLHAWLRQRADEIEGDEQARGVLGKLHTFETQDGALRSPRELLLTPGLDDLDLPGRPSAAVPPELTAWLARLYRLDESTLGPLVDALLDASARAAQDGDRARLLRLNLALAAATAPPAGGGARAAEHEARVERVLRAQRASRRLRVADEQGEPRRPRDLLLTSPERHALVKKFHINPPPRFAGPDELRALLSRLGAPGELGADDLALLMRPPARLAGDESTLALARYVAAVATETPSLRQHLDLDRTPWVPAADGSLRTPGELFWPAPGLDDLLGPRPDALPHPLFALTAPPTLGRWLRFRTAADATLDDVLGGLPAQPPASLEALRWLENALQTSRLSASTLRQALASRALFADPQGDPERFPRLTGASPPDPLSWPQERGGAAEAKGTPPAPARSPAHAPAPAHSPARAPAHGPTRAPARPPPAPPLPSPEAGRGAGGEAFWKRWFHRPEPPDKEPPRQEPPPSPPPPRATTRRDPPRKGAQQDWYRPRSDLGPQLETAPEWQRSRGEAPRYGFALSPGMLPPPYLYAPSMMGVRFNAGAQRWERGAAPAAWLRASGRAVGRVNFRGNAPAGEVTLPRPLCASVEGARFEGRALEVSLTTDGLALVYLPREGELSFEVTLHEAPRYSEKQGDFPAETASMLDPTAHDDELPGELHELVERLLASRLSPPSRALQVRDFIREHYRYDPSYLEDERVARWLQRSTRSSSHQHLAALHAGRSGRTLGAGVCYELNALCCELLRRVQIPAAVCSGWVLDRAQIDEPDHLWAMALLPSDQGPGWMPLDASTTRDGRPLTVSHRPAGDFRAPAAASAPPPAPAWAAQQPRPSALGASPPVNELARAVRYIAQQQGAAIEDEATLRRRLRALLEDPAQARRLLDLLRGS